MRLLVIALGCYEILVCVIAGLRLTDAGNEISDETIGKNRRSTPDLDRRHIPSWQLHCELASLRNARGTKVGRHVAS